MINVSFALPFFLAAAQALTWRHPRTFPSFLRRKIPAALVSSSMSRYFTTSPPRLTTTFLSNSKRSSSPAGQQSKAESNTVAKKMRAVKHLLKGGNSTTAPEDIREYVLIYEGGDEEYLRDILKLLQRQKTALVSRQLVESKGKSLAIPEEFNFDVASWKVGEFVDCTALSEMMQSFGGFPSSLLVREEMKVVWSILVDGIAKQKTRWVMFGSPGVGKSILTVLLCFHLAQAHGKPMFLVRRLYGENDGPQSGVVAICIHPGGRAVGYPKEDDDDVDLKAIRAAFGTSYKRPTRMTTVLDGWSQSELARSTVGELFGNFNLLITFEQYKQDYEDFRHLVILPSWKDESFQSLWNHLGWEPSTFHEHRYYSSGSVRDFFRPIIEIQSRTHRVTAGLPEKMCMGLMARYGHSSGEYIDYLRHCYLDNNNSESYIDPSCWKNMVVSAYALKLLSVNAPLDVYERSVEVAESCGPIHYGWVFKALVHQLFRIPNMVVTFHVRRDHQVGAPEDEYESISLGKKVSIECHGKNYSEATLSLSNRFVDMTRNTYWHPNYPMFPVIDAIVCLPDKKTILYVHLTVGTEHDVDFEQLTEIHDTVKQSLQVTDSEGWTFKYVAIGPRELNVNRITLNLKTNKNKSTARTVDEVTIWKGYVTYSIE